MSGQKIDCRTMCILEDMKKVVAMSYLVDEVMYEMDVWKV
jgi:hypothetical protein